MLEIGGEQLQLRRDPLPIVERGLQGRREMAGVGAPGEVAAHHHETAVAALFQATQFHVAPPSFQRKLEFPAVNRVQLALE